MTKANTIPMILVSGGEPMEHPQALEFLSLAKEELHVAMLSNGMFISDVGLRDAVIGLGISVQITTDPRFYGTRIERFEHPSFMYEDEIRLVTPLGRAATNKIECNRQSPLCFNLRSATRSTGDVWEAIKALRKSGKMCTARCDRDGPGEGAGLGVADEAGPALPLPRPADDPSRAGAAPQETPRPRYRRCAASC